MAPSSACWTPSESSGPAVINLGVPKKENDGARTYISAKAFILSLMCGNGMRSLLCYLPLIRNALIDKRYFDARGGTIGHFSRRVRFRIYRTKHCDVSTFYGTNRSVCLVIGTSPLRR